MSDMFSCLSRWRIFITRYRQIIWQFLYWSVTYSQKHALACFGPRGRHRKMLILNILCINDDKRADVNRLMTQHSDCIHVRFIRI